MYTGIYGNREREKYNHHDNIIIKSEIPVVVIDASSILWLVLGMMDTSIHGNPKWKVCNYMHMCLVWVQGEVRDGEKFLWVIDLSQAVVSLYGPYLLV